MRLFSSVFFLLSGLFLILFSINESFINECVIHSTEKIKCKVDSIYEQESESSRADIIVVSCYNEKIKFTYNKKMDTDSVEVLRCKSCKQTIIYETNNRIKNIIIFFVGLFLLMIPILLKKYWIKVLRFMITHNIKFGNS